MSEDNSTYLTGKVTGKGKSKIVKIEGQDVTDAILDVLSAVHVAMSANGGKCRKYNDKKGK